MTIQPLIHIGTSGWNYKHPILSGNNIGPIGNDRTINSISKPVGKSAANV